MNTSLPLSSPSSLPTREEEQEGREWITNLRVDGECYQKHFQKMGLKNELRYKRCGWIVTGQSLKPRRDGSMKEHGWLPMVQGSGV